MKNHERTKTNNVQVNLLSNGEMRICAEYEYVIFHIFPRSPDSRSDVRANVSDVAKVERKTLKKALIEGAALQLHSISLTNNN